MRSLGWALIQYDWCPYEKRRWGHRHIQREDRVRIQGEGGHLQAKDRDLRGNQPWKHPDLELEKTDITHQWYSVSATLGPKRNRLWEASSGTPHPTLTFVLQPSRHTVLPPLFEFSLQREPTKVQPHTFRLQTALSVSRYSLLCAAIHVIETIEVYNDNIGTL